MQRCLIIRANVLPYLTWSVCHVKSPRAKSRGVKHRPFFSIYSWHCSCDSESVAITLISLPTFGKCIFGVQASELTTNRTQTMFVFTAAKFCRWHPCPDRCLSKQSYKWKWCLTRRTSSFAKRWGYYSTKSQS